VTLTATARRADLKRQRSDQAIRTLDSFFPSELEAANPDLAQVARSLHRGRIRRRGRVRVLRRLDSKRIRAYAFAQTLRGLRLKRGLRQEDLARKAGIARPNIARLERGTHLPSTETLRRLAAALGVSLSRLLEGRRGSPDRDEGPLAEAGLPDWLASLDREDRE
jgi:transcriptional regulator with XRE-family HTH domain